MTLHLVFNGFPVLGVAHYGELQLSHLLHLAVHVDLLEEATDLAPEEPQGVLLSLALGEEGGAGRVDGCHPVL